MIFDGGSLPGVDRERLVLGLSGVTNAQDVDAAVRQAFSGGDLRFSAGKAALTISDGFASLGPVAVRAGELSGDMKALVELMSGRTELQMELAISGESDTPAVSLVYSGPRDRLERSLDAGAFKKRLRARALREEMAKLEELQREEEKIIAEEVGRAAEQRRQVEKEKRAREREDDLNGLLGILLDDLNRQELVRRQRELAAWRAGVRPSPEAAPPATTELPRPQFPQYQFPQPQFPQPSALSETVTEPTAPVAAPESPARKPEPASAPKPAVPGQTRLLAPAAPDGLLTSTLPEVKIVPQSARRYRTNFNRNPARIKAPVANRLR
jgi:hypothetical protein